MDDRIIINMLRFLALSHDDMVRYIPTREDQWYRFVDDEGGVMDVVAPAEASARICAELIHRLLYSSNRGFDCIHDLLGEIQVVLVTMLDLSGHIAAYHWMLDKEHYGITGPYDGLWSVVCRLSREALRILDSSPTPLQLSFEDLMEIGHVRIVPPSPTEGE